MRLHVYILILGLYLMFRWLVPSDAGRLFLYDVGQGDAIFVKGQEGEKIVIDGGPNIEISRYLSMFFLTKKCEIDLLVLTHPHFDHLRGLNRLLQYCKVSSVLHFPVIFSSKEYDNWSDLNLVASEIFSEVGNVINVGNFELHILGPVEGALDFTHNVNNASIVLLLKYDTFDALLMGDAETAQLRMLDLEYLLENISGELEVLKVGHHGARNAIPPNWPKALIPQKCLISVGEGNKFEHPHEEALTFYKNLGCEIMRTDLNGTIEVLIE